MSNSWNITLIIIKKQTNNFWIFIAHEIIKKRKENQDSFLEADKNNFTI